RDDRRRDRSGRTGRVDLPRNRDRGQPADPGGGRAGRASRACGGRPARDPGAAAVEMEGGVRKVLLVLAAALALSHCRAPATAPVRTGSQNFSEQILPAEIVAQAVE